MDSVWLDRVVFNSAVVRALPGPYVEVSTQQKLDPDATNHDPTQPDPICIYYANRTQSTEVLALFAEYT